MLYSPLCHSEAAGRRISSPSNRYFNLPLTCRIAPINATSCKIIAKNGTKCSRITLLYTKNCSLTCQGHLCPRQICRQHRVGDGVLDIPHIKQKGRTFTLCLLPYSIFCHSAFTPLLAVQLLVRVCPGPPLTQHKPMYKPAPGTASFSSAVFTVAVQPASYYCFHLAILAIFPACRLVGSLSSHSWILSG